MIVIGIDPGTTGAVAVFRINEQEKSMYIDIKDTPTKQVMVKKRGGKTVQKLEYNEYAMSKILKQYANTSEVILCAIEKAQAMSKRKDNDGNVIPQGTVSMFGYGKGYGIWLGILATLGIQIHEVHPLSWKKKLLSDMPKGKDASVQKVKLLFPNFASQYITLKKHHGRADAVLIAEFIRRSYQIKAEANTQVKV